jgi:hypothetical protein
VFSEIHAPVKGSNEHGLAPCQPLEGKPDPDLRDTAVTWLSGEVFGNLVGAPGLEPGTR